MLESLSTLVEMVWCVVLWFSVSGMKLIYNCNFCENVGRPGGLCEEVLSVCDFKFWRK